MLRGEHETVLHGDTNVGVGGVLGHRVDEKVRKFPPRGLDALFAELSGYVCHEGLADDFIAGDVREEVLLYFGGVGAEEVAVVVAHDAGDGDGEGGVEGVGVVGLAGDETCKDFEVAVETGTVGTRLASGKTIGLDDGDAGGAVLGGDVLVYLGLSRLDESRLLRVKVGKKSWEGQRGSGRSLGG